LTISITDNNETFVIEGEDAKEILDEVPDNIKPRDFILGMM